MKWLLGALGVVGVGLGVYFFTRQSKGGPQAVTALVSNNPDQTGGALSNGYGGVNARGPDLTAQSGQGAAQSSSGSGSSRAFSPSSFSGVAASSTASDPAGGNVSTTSLGDLLSGTGTLTGGVAFVPTAGNLRIGRTA